MALLKIVALDELVDILLVILFGMFLMIDGGWLLSLFM